MRAPVACEIFAKIESPFCCTSPELESSGVGSSVVGFSGMLSPPSRLQADNVTIKPHNNKLTENIELKNFFIYAISKSMLRQNLYLSRRHIALILYYLSLQESSRRRFSFLNRNLRGAASAAVLIVIIRSLISLDI